MKNKCTVPETPDRNTFCEGIEVFEKHEPRDAMYIEASRLFEKYWGENNWVGAANAIGILLLTWNQAFYRYASFDFKLLQNYLKDNHTLISKFKSGEINVIWEKYEDDIINLFIGFLEVTQLGLARFKQKDLGDLRNILCSMGINHPEKTENEDMKNIYHSIKSRNPDSKYAFDYFTTNGKNTQEEVANIQIDSSVLPRAKVENLLKLDLWNKHIKKSPVSVSKALHLLAPRVFPLWDGKIAKQYCCNYSVKDLYKKAKQYISFCEKIREVAEQVKEYECVKDKISEDKTLVKLIDEYNYARFTKHWIGEKEK